MKKQSGFTLVELLVVIAVIAMLLAIMAPVLVRSRLLGSRITCLSNLKQLGIAIEIYTQSYKYYPVCVSDVAEKWDKFLADKSIAQGKMLGVPVSLWPFYQSANLYNCPILDRAGADISYCYNWLAGKKYLAGETELACVFPSDIRPKPEPKKEETLYHLLAPEEVRTPGIFVLLYDVPVKPQETTDKLFGDIDPDDSGSSDPDEKGYLADANAGPHSNGFNILFSDGHSKRHKRWNKSEISRNPK